MDDDLNTPDALAAVFDLVKEINTLSAASSKEALEASAKPSTRSPMCWA